MRRSRKVLTTGVVTGMLVSLVWAVVPLSAGRSLAAASGPVRAKPVPGWPGQKAQYLGRYRLVSSSDTTLAQQGQLTVFMRVVPPRISPVPLMSGILTLYGSAGAQLLYVTLFSHSGSTLLASVHAGIYTGPLVGKFIVLALSPDHLKVSFVMTGGGKAVLSFVRFSPNPHP